MIRYVKFVPVPVRDQDRALAFYRDVMGFTVATDAPYEDERRWIEIGVPGAETHLVFMPKPDDAIPQVPTVVLVSDDVHADFETLRGKGVKFTAEPTATPWAKGEYYALFLDSENNLLMLGHA
jgi:predicted enzyme related to lactoylglutathione lyase